jgi:hypothetical protein
MSNFWKIGSKEDTLCYYVAALTREQAITEVQKLTGPLKHGTIQQVPERPKGYVLTGQVPCILDEDPEYDGE